jgi:hypothetical protein
MSFFVFTASEAITTTDNYFEVGLEITEGEELPTLSH